MQNLDQDHISDFAGLGAAPMPRGSRDYINAGRYTAQITKVKKVRSTKPHEIDANGRGALMVIIELTIVEVLQHRVYMGRNEAGEMVEKESNAPGDLCSQVIKMLWPKAKSKVKGFLAATMGLTPAVVLELEKKPGAWPEIMDRACHGGSPETSEVKPMYLNDDGSPKGEPWQSQPLAGVVVEMRAKTEPQKKNPLKEFTEVEYFNVGASHHIASVDGSEQ